MYFKKRKAKEKYQVENTKPRSEVVKFSLWFFGIDKISCTLFRDSGYRIPESFLCELKFGLLVIFLLIIMRQFLFF